MPKRTTSYIDDLRERLRDDPEHALAYLKATFEDEEDAAEPIFLMALCNVARSQNKPYVVESGTGRPSLTSVRALLKKLGFCLSIEACQPVKKRAKKIKP